MSDQQTAWVIVLDDVQEYLIWADDITDVFSFIQFNQTALFGHENIGHINIQIDKLSEAEINERFNPEPEPEENLYEKLANEPLEFTVPVDLDLARLFGVNGHFTI